MVKMTTKDVSGLFHNRYYAADETEQVFGFRPKDITLPEYWKPEDYELHAEAGHLLICYPNRLPNLEPVTFEEMAKRALAGKSVSEGLLWQSQFSRDGNLVSDWILNDPLQRNGMPRSGWQFVSLDALSETREKDFIEQTNTLIRNMEQCLHHAIPPILWDAKSKWEGYERDFARSLIKRSEQKAASMYLSSLDVTRFLREPVQNAFFRYLLVFGMTGEKLFGNAYSWSSSLSSDGRLVYFGLADVLGASVGRPTPAGSSSRLRAVASRSGV